jgi:tetratricopeptide (TPR) repeat protein
MRRDPSQKQESLVEVAALKYFTNREGAIEAFERYLNAPAGTDLRVLTFYGVGGIGKTTLINKLRDNLRQAQIPHARFDLQTVRDPTQAYREALLQMRCDLESQFRISFPRFDLCLAVILAREGGEPPPLVQINPFLQDAFKFITSIFQAPREGLGGLIDSSIRRLPQLEAYVRKVFNTEDVIHLRNLALRDDQKLYEELIRRFAEDLKENLPPRAGKACRGVLFLDTYEAFWSGREVHTAQGRLLDEWVRHLAEYCLGSGVLLVISGRDRLMWDEDNPDWRGWLDQHLLGGLSARDAQAFLSKCGVGPPPDEPTTPLQQAIIECCDTEPGPVVSCHPLYLALCAEIVLNTRQIEGVDPKPDVFRGIPSQQVTRELATRFLKSLHNRAMELWVTELSLTPRFDQAAALALDTKRQHQNGRAGWELLTRFSFVEALPDGFYRLHKTMAEVLRQRIPPNQASAIHEWFHGYWSGRELPSLMWFHRWQLEPSQALAEWEKAHETALKERRIGEARALLEWWQDIELDEGERKRLGDELWAKAHFGLGVALVKTPVVSRASALLTAIEHFQSALRVYTETEFPYDWAGTQHNLGTAYFELPTGDRSENLRRAIACYENALRVYTETEFPYDWAMTQHNLGNAYSKLPTGDRSENLRRAIACYENALRVYTETEFPYNWAGTQHNLGTAYSNLPTGDRGENLRRAIACYENALRVYTETEFPVDWAGTQNNLGNAYSKLPTGDRSENLRKAIACYENALRVRTETEFPYDWASTQNNLGHAYSELPTGDRGENLRRAIACYENALRVRTETEFPYEWAGTQNNLGNAYSNLPTGDRSENLRRAIEYYENALRVYTEANFPYEWARTQNNLGLAYAQLPTGDRDENLRTAIGYYENALRVYTEANFPVDWARTQNNLGLAYAQLPTGDRDENLRTAIGYYENALRVYTEANFPVDWARTQNNLGLAYAQLPTGDRDENLRTAIGYYENALRVYTEANFPVDWAGTQHNLGNAYSELPTGDRSENLRRAIACYENALRVYTETEFPVDWASTQNNLGNAYLFLPTGDRSENLRRAIACYENALRVYTEANFPYEWAGTQHNLGVALAYLADETGDARLLDSARACFEAAARGFEAAGLNEQAAHARQILKQLESIDGS